MNDAAGHIGHVLKFVRVSSNLKQGDLSILSGVSVSYISLLERGKREPGMDILRKLFNALRFNLVLAMFLAEGSDLGNDSLNEKMSHAVLKRLQELGEFEEENEN